MQTIVVWLLIGLVAGGIGGLAIHARGIAVLGYVAAGVAGAVLGGMVAGKLFGIDVLARLTPPMLIESVLGALAVVIVLRRLPQREHAPEWRRRT